jgi:hypothetical protein
MLTTQVKLKEESDILHNIRKREMIDKINKGTGVEKREKEEKKKIHDQFGIASGILNTRNLLLAPITNVINQSDKVCTYFKTSPNLRFYFILNRNLLCSGHLLISKSILGPTHS